MPVLVNLLFIIFTNKLVLLISRVDGAFNLLILIMKAFIRCSFWGYVWGVMGFTTGLHRIHAHIYAVFTSVVKVFL